MSSNASRWLNATSAFVCFFALLVTTTPIWGATCAPDVNGDMVVDITDVIEITNQLGSSNIRLDLNGNGNVGSVDVFIAVGYDFAPPSLCTCPADFNGDNRVNDLDFRALLSAYGTVGCQADLDFNGVINNNDVDIIQEVILNFDTEPRADVNFDGFINIDDIIFTQNLTGRVDCRFDLNKDSIVDPSDYFFALGDSGACP